MKHKRNMKIKLVQNQKITHQLEFYIKRQDNHQKPKLLIMYLN